MNRKSLLFCVLILGISLLAGCGGGKKDDTKTKGTSSDFMGIEVGAVKTYNLIANGVDSGNFSRKVLAAVEGNPGVFKIGIIKTGQTEPEYGDYIGIDGNTYYIRGDWDNTEDPPYDYLSPTSEHIYVINPIPDGFISDEYGNLVGKETVTTPAGKFEAYKFHNHHEGTDSEGVPWTDDEYTWFVPYLGEVMGYYEETENGVVTDKSTVKIISY